MSAGEVWRSVPSVPEILVSSEGRMMIAPYWGIMPHGGDRPYGGQPHFGVWNKQDGRFITVYKGKTYKIARLVCEAFNGAAGDGEVCMHMDENAANNRAENLHWGTQKENLNAPKYRASKRLRPLTAMCANCSSVFEPKTKTQKYCSRPCSYANNSEHSLVRYQQSEWRL